MIGPAEEALDPVRRSSGGECLFQLGGQRGRQPIFEQIRGAFPTRQAEAPRGERAYFDTADRRLRAAGARLSIARDGDASVLRWTQADGSVRVARVPGEPAFATDLPPGPLREALGAVIAERRLLPLAEVADAIPPIDVLDRRGKTVVRVALERWKPTSPETTPSREPLLLRVAPVKGYRKAFERVLGIVAEAQTPGPVVEADPLALIGVREDEVKARPVCLDEGMRTDTAVKTLLLAQVEAIEGNEAGTRQATDPEFLHEYRVAIRRTRVALSRLTGVFPQRTTERFKREFRWLGSVTGRARDLDVYLLELPHYKQALPEDAGDHLDPLRGYLEEGGKAAYVELDGALSTARYRRLMRDWRTFLERPVPQRTQLPHAARPVKEYAAERIWQMHRKVLKRGGAIDSDTPDEAVHDLRLSCKKLRYLMEFFRSLFDAGEIRTQIKALKRLQDVLGEFNDLAVQQGSLMETAEDMTGAGRAPLETVVTLGRLVEVLAARQRDARIRFHDRFDEFAAEANRKRARRLFRADAEEGAR